MNPRARTPFLLWPQPVPDLLANEKGATAVEYGLIAALVVLAILGGLKALGADLAGLPLQAIVVAIQSV